VLAHTPLLLCAHKVVSKCHFNTHHFPELDQSRKKSQQKTPKATHALTDPAAMADDSEQQLFKVAISIEEVATTLGVSEARLTQVYTCMVSRQWLPSDYYERDEIVDGITVAHARAKTAESNMHTPYAIEVEASEKAKMLLYVHMLEMMLQSGVRRVHLSKCTPVENGAEF
jgi:DNA-directed RNA polymerase specialized sigma subunit